MIYYSVSITGDERITGDVYPQVVLTQEYERTLYRHFEGKSSFKDRVVGEFQKRAMVTQATESNILSLDSFIFSEKIVSCIKRFNTCDFELLPIDLTFRGKKQNGYFFAYFHATVKGQTIFDFVDFENSKFVSNDFMDLEEPTPILVNDYQECVDIQEVLIEKGLCLKLKKLKLRNESTFLDFFCLKQFDFRFYVSERLRLELEGLGITGLEFSETSLD